MPRARLKLKTRRRVPDYPSIEQRTPEQLAELEAYLSGESDSRPDWVEYPRSDDRFWFGPAILTLQERARLHHRDYEVREAQGDDDDDDLEVA